MELKTKINKFLKFTSLRCLIVTLNNQEFLVVVVVVFFFWRNCDFSCHRK